MRILTILLLLTGIGLVGWHYGPPWYDAHRQDFPWTPLDLNLPTGNATGVKIRKLSEDYNHCQGLLSQGGFAFSLRPDQGNGSCHAASLIEPERKTGGWAYAPTEVYASCPVAAALALWQRDIVQPLAEKYFGERVATLRHYGSYSCRRINGKTNGRWSEHATANAIDIAGFVLTSGRHIRIAQDWHPPGVTTDFLREVRDGACEVFSTVLSPDYNTAHHDHLHLDQVRRGTGYTVCR